MSEAHRLNLTEQHLYSAADIIFLKENYIKYGENYCAKKLNRTAKAIRRFANNLGLKRLPQGTPIYCPELDKTFASIKDASNTLNISDGNICSVINGRLKQTNNLHFYKIDKEQYYEKRKN